MAHFADAVANPCCCHAISVFPCFGEHLRKVNQQGRANVYVVAVSGEERKVGELESLSEERYSIASALLDASFVLPTVLALFLGWPRARDDSMNAIRVRLSKRGGESDRGSRLAGIGSCTRVFSVIRESREKVAVFIADIFLAMVVPVFTASVTIRSVYGCAGVFHQSSQTLVLSNPTARARLLWSVSGFG